MFKTKLRRQALAFVVIVLASAALYPAAQGGPQWLVLALLTLLALAQGLILLTG